jgi:hypothetical protein
MGNWKMHVSVTLMAVLGAIFLVCAIGGPPVIAIVLALAAIFMGGLTASIGGTLVLTNVYKINYEIAFSRSFYSGAALIAVIIAVWTAIANLLTGGITSDIVVHLQHTSLVCACVSFAAACATMVTWAVIVFSRRKSGG